VFVKEVHAVALFPGGFGTQDEGFETLTLVQTGKRDPMPIVLVDEPGGTYWSTWERFVHEELLKRELVSPKISRCSKLPTTWARPSLKSSISTRRTTVCATCATS